MIGSRLEDRIVVLAARSRLDPLAETRLCDLCAAEPNWPTVARISSQQGVFPVVVSTLMRLDLVPPEVEPRLDFEMRRIAARNLMLTGELLALLAAVGVQALAFKGPIAALSLYRNLGMRQFHDLDLLIDPAFVDMARMTLLNDGYRLERHLSAENEALLVTQAGVLALFGPRGIRVDLHVTLMTPRHSRRLATSDVMKRAARVDLLSGLRVSTLSSSDLAIYLSLHGIKHGWERLEWLCDLARLADRMTPSEQSALLERACRLGHERAVLSALTLAHRVLDAPAVPLGKLADATATLVRRFERTLMVPPVADPVELRYAAAYDRHRDRVRHLLEVLFRPSLTDVLAFRLPRPLHFLRWLLRPVRLGGRLARIATLSTRCRGGFPWSAWWRSWRRPQRARR
jgi:hypothetical protein